MFVGSAYINYWLMDVVGMFVHQWDVRVKDIAEPLHVQCNTTHTYWMMVVNMRQIIYIGINLYSATMLATKAAILKEWARLFVPYGSRNAFFWICHVLLIVTVLFNGTVLISTNLTCFPREKIWDKTIPGKCSNPKVTLIISSVINVILDFFILLLPQNIIWRLQMTKKKKVGMSLIFTIGILYDDTPFPDTFLCPPFLFPTSIYKHLVNTVLPRTVACACGRLAVTIPYYYSEDTMYTISPVSLWAFVEMTCTFLVFCVPAGPQVFTHLTAFLASWTGFLGKRLDKSASTWPQTNFRTSERNSMYRKMNKTHENGIPLTQFSAQRNSNPDLTEWLGEEPRNIEAGIVCTTHITIREDYMGPRREQEGFRLQHPWTEGGS